MTNNEFKTLLNKYAILIFIGYLLSFLIIIIAHRLIPYQDVNSKAISFLASSSWIIQFIFNIIAAVLISKDLKKVNCKNNLIVIMTILFSLIGITMFFITLNREVKESVTE